MPEQAPTIPSPGEPGLVVPDNSGVPSPDPTIPSPAPPAEPPVLKEPDASVRVVPAATEYKLPEGIPAEFGEFANANQFTQEQLDATLKHFGEFIGSTETAKVKAMRGLGEAHIKNWGADAGYNKQLAKRALQLTDPSGKLNEVLVSSGYINHPVVLDYLLSTGKMLKEGGFIKSEVPRNPGQKTLAEVMYGDKHPTERS